MRTLLLFRSVLTRNGYRAETEVYTFIHPSTQLKELVVSFLLVSHILGKKPHQIKSTDYICLDNYWQHVVDIPTRCWGKNFN